MNYLQPERLDRLAREYVLGTLNGGARRRFERLLRQTAAARLAVDTWQERFSVLAAGVPPMPPRDAVWRGLEQRLFQATAGAAPSKTLPSCSPAWRCATASPSSGCTVPPARIFWASRSVY